MKFRVGLLALAVMMSLSTVVAANEAADEYKKLMLPAAIANIKLQNSVQTDLIAATQAATDVQAAFAEIEAFWTKRGTADAVGFAQSVQAAAKEVHDAAGAGNQEAAVAAAKKIVCESCHMAHRTRLPDGTFDLR